MSCDFAGGIDTLWLRPEHLAAPLSVRGFTAGGPVGQLAFPGSPTHSGEVWLRWDAGEVALHIEHAGGRVQVVTLMHRPSLSPSCSGRCVRARATSVSVMSPGVQELRAGTKLAAALGPRTSSR